ncbi:MAG: ketopantoate reductase family protein [Dehalococcoidia bacterium]
MRFVVFGAGAVGGVVGGRLAQAGHDVALIARGEHGAAIRARGLTIESPAGAATVTVECVDRPADLGFQADDVVILGMKTQDTAAALDDLLEAAGDAIPVICAQNGVENERIALRRFAHVYGMPVRLPATHLEPGVVQADSAPYSGVLDVGRYPEGVDDTCAAVCAALERSTFSARPEPKVMRHKYNKLLGMNLSNALQVIAGDEAAGAADLMRRARAEAAACYAAAGIDCATEEEDRIRRGDLIKVGTIEGRRRGGGSTWQSLARGKRVLEVDYLNGEIVMLGRLWGVATPVNYALQQVANRLAREGQPPGAMTLREFEAQVQPITAGETRESD